MASTFTTALLLELQGTGDNDGTWGTTLNAVIQDVDDAVAGSNSKSVAGSSDVTLTDAEARYANQVYTGTLTGNINVIVPARTGFYYVDNDTSGSFTLTVKTSSGTGILVPQGAKMLLYCDGTDVVTPWDTVQHLQVGVTTLTLSSGAATITGSRHTIAAESGTSDDFDTATASNVVDGALLWLRADAGDTIYATAAGNFAQPVMLDDTTWVPFVWDGTNSKWELLLAGWVPLDVQTASSSSALDFTKGIGAAYDTYLFEIAGIIPATDDASLLARTDANGGASFDATGGDYEHVRDILDLGAGSPASVLGGSASATSILLANNLSNGATTGIEGCVLLHQPSDSARHAKLSWANLVYQDNGGDLRAASGFGKRTAAAIVDAVRFLMSSGNIASGSIALYGLRK